MATVFHFSIFWIKWGRLVNKAGLVFFVIFPLILCAEVIKDSFIDKNPDISAIKKELNKRKEE